MLSLRKWIVPVAGMALLLGSQVGARADDAAAPAGKAKITVTVVDKNGTAVAGAQVNLMHGAKRDKSAAAADGQKPGKPTPMAQATTDKDGKASFADLADGEYGVMARVKTVGNGRSKVSVANGSDAEVTITLASKKGGAGPTVGADKPAAPADPATPAAPADPK